MIIIIGYDTGQLKIRNLPAGRFAPIPVITAPILPCIMTIMKTCAQKKYSRFL